MQNGALHLLHSARLGAPHNLAMEQSSQTPEIDRQIAVAQRWYFHIWAGGFVITHLGDIWPPAVPLSRFRWIPTTLLLGGWVYFVIRRRSPYWTPQSWRHYLRALVRPIVCGAVALTMAKMVDMHAPIAGPALSRQRSLWVAAMVGLLLYSAFRWIRVVYWALDGNAAEQFQWPRRKKAAFGDTPQLHV